ncbi:MAG: hypothetical protein CVU77_06955 [Elusimicrobia bacterium HGW-Elusimicrobia-1]|nr:MAG: hypothetical protein CVU77_06955 [Elusimicrobia bacterium HGW-Elusimicrobia-1]
MKKAGDFLLLKKIDDHPPLKKGETGGFKMCSGAFGVVVVLSLLTLLAFPPVAVRAAEFSSVGNFSFLGGQYLYAGSPSALSGHFSAGFSPSLKFSPSATGILTYSGSYRGTKEVAELAGGGTLFSDSQSHAASLKFVLTPRKNLKIRPVVSYRKEFLRETLDEQWMKGLFDYDKVAAGAEAEYAFSRNHSIAASADYFTIQFPNYISLESRQTADLGREQAGSRTLDSNNIMISGRSSHTFGRRIRLFLDGASISKGYPEQPVAVSLDALSATSKRVDSVLTASLKIAYPISFSRKAGIVFEPGYSYTVLDSNQNRADARKAVFITDYYDYTASAPSVNLHFLPGDGPVTITAGGSRSFKNYAARPAQNADGDYLADKIYVNETLASLSLVYPLAGDTKMRASFSHLRSESNMKYESIYKYNFESSAYFMGFNFDF